MKIPLLAIIALAALVSGYGVFADVLRTATSLPATVTVERLVLVGPSGPTSVSQNATVDYEIQADDVADMAAGQATFIYDPSLFSIDSVALDSGFISCLNVVNDDGLGTMDLGLICTGTHSGTPLTLWVVTLTAAAVDSPQETTFAVTSTTLGDLVENEIPSAGTDLAVTIAPTPPVGVAPTGAALAPRGTHVAYEIQAEDVANLAAAQATFTYDQSLFRFIEAAPATGFDGCLSIVNGSSLGEIQLGLVCTVGHTGAPLPLWIVTLEPILARPELEQEIDSQVGITGVTLGDINEQEIFAKGATHNVTTTFMCGDVHPVGGGDQDDDVLDALRKLKIAVGLVEASPRELIAGDIHPDNALGPDGDRDIDVLDALRDLKASLGLGGEVDSCGGPSLSPIQDTLNVGVATLGLIDGVGDPKEHGAGNGIHRSNVTVFETLVVSAPDGELVPRLLSSWSISDDGLVWTFNLKEGVQFHNGYGEITAEDVVWTLMRASEEGSKFGRAGQLRATFGTPTVIQVLDDYKIDVTTETPKFDALFSLRAPYGAGLPMQSKAAFDDEMVNHPIGTGSWRFVKAEAGQFWEFEAVEEHWRKTPFFEGLKIIEIPEESTRLAALQAGILDTGEFNPTSVGFPREEEGFKLIVSEDAGQVQWNLHGQFYSADRPGYNPGAPWVSSNNDINSPEWDTARKVRLAMAIAINRNQIVDEILGGEGRAQYYWGDSGNTVLDPLKEANPEPFAYDPGRAQQLLSEAGYPDGFDLPVACYTRGLPGDVQACQAVAGMWDAIGINTDVQLLNYSELRPLMFERNMEVVHPHGLGTYPEPMALWPNSIWVEGGWNAGFEHPVVDLLIQSARSEFKPDARFEVTRQISQFLVDNVTHLPVYAPNMIYPVGPKIDPWPQLGGAKNIIHNLEFVPPRSQ